MKTEPPRISNTKFQPVTLKSVLKYLILFWRDYNGIALFFQGKVQPVRGSTFSGSICFNRTTNEPYLTMNGSSLLIEPTLTNADSDMTIRDLWSAGNVLQLGGSGFIVVVIALVVGNSLVLYCIACYRFLRNPTDIFVCVLAGVDLSLATSVAIQAVQVVVPTVFTELPACHYDDVIMGTIASQITSLTIVCTTIYSDADQRKYQSSAPLVFVRRIHQRPVNSPHKWPVTRTMFPFDDVIMPIQAYFGDIQHRCLRCRRLVG